ncbi:MAG: hypothetical protein LUC37_00765 [Prevotella sp.]|nr:hypothetical protein [Prevotella sp.]
MNSKEARFEAEAKCLDLLRYRFSLDFYVFKERHVYIAYCPSLDISTSGKDFIDAVANFRERFRIHIDWCIQHGTLVDDLMEHGWKLKKSTITPPSFDYLLKNNEGMKKLLSGRRAYGKLVMSEKLYPREEIV